jgi:malonyl-CoA decarboxylase
MAVSIRVQRLLAGVRRWRSVGHDEPLAVHPDLPDGDIRRLTRLCDDIVDTKGGEVTSRGRARQLGLTYSTLNETGRRQFFDLLARHYGHDDLAVDEAIDRVLHARALQDRRSAENDLRDALRPRRELILRRFVGLDGGLPFLIDTREDLRRYLADRRDLVGSTVDPSPVTTGSSDPSSKAVPGRGGASVEALTDLDGDLRRILERWFDVALLRLERLTWHTPASFLEKLIQYEAVHAIGSWSDLKLRLGPGRRCYAFIHPAMPDDPLIFVEVAFTRGMANSVKPLLGSAGEHGGGGDSAGGPADDQTMDGPVEPIDESEFDTAIFYSISNCHDGLSGVSLGDFLIKSVVEELSTEVPNLKRFATLSPLPGFRSWLLDHLNSELAKRPEATFEAQPGTGSGGGSEVADGAATSTPADAGRSSGDGPADPRAGRRRDLFLLRDLAAGPMPHPQDRRLEDVKPLLLALAADYIVTRRRSRRPGSSRSSERAIDPVAHFHLSNGARAERLNWLANPTDIGWDRGLALMINYRYELKWIEDNHDRYLEDGEINASEAMIKLLAPLSDS